MHDNSYIVGTNPKWKASDWINWHTILSIELERLTSSDS